MNDALKTLRNYPQIYKWLNSWFQQLINIGQHDDYRVILSELVELRKGVMGKQHFQNLERLDYHLCIASTVAINFKSIILEKTRLGTNIDEANLTILNKLAEIRAIVGLQRLGFKNIQFVKTPDLLATLKGIEFLIEVTRLGPSLGKRSKVWDWETGSIDSGMHIGMEVNGGKSVSTLADAIYHEIEDKYPQLKKSKQKTDSMIVWISLGRDYLTAGRYELPDVSLQLKMPNAKKALDIAFQQIKNTGLYSSISYVVLSRGRDNNDLVSPRLNINEQSL